MQEHNSWGISTTVPQQEITRKWICIYDLHFGIKINRLEDYSGTHGFK